MFILTEFDNNTSERLFQSKANKFILRTSSIKWTFEIKYNFLMFQQRTPSFEMLILFWIYLNLWSAWHRQTDFWHLIKTFCALALTKSLLGKRKKSLNFHLKTFWIKMKRFLIFRLLLESSWNVNQSFLMLEPIYYWLYDISLL